MPPGSWIRTQALRAAEGASPPADRFAAPPPSEPPAHLARPVATRLEDRQAEALRDHARACGLPVSAYIRKALLGARLVPRRPLARAAIAAVNRVGNNLNQLVHLAHTGILLTPELLRTLAEVLAAFQAVQDALLDADTDKPPEPTP